MENVTEKNFDTKNLLLSLEKLQLRFCIVMFRHGLRRENFDRVYYSHHCFFSKVPTALFGIIFTLFGVGFALIGVGFSYKSYIYINS